MSGEALILEMILSLNSFANRIEKTFDWKENRIVFFFIKSVFKKKIKQIIIFVSW